MFPSITSSPNFRTWIKHPAGGVRNYNGSTCKCGASLLHAWRSEDAVGKSTIRIGRVHASGKIAHSSTGISDPAFDAEDPRLFVLNGTLWLAWSKVRDTRHEMGQWQVVQMLSRVDLKSLAVLSSAPLELPFPLRHCEKNWTPLPDGGWVYDFQAGISVGADGCVIRNAPWEYPWGSLSGSTPALAWPGRCTWLAFYHGFMADPLRVKRYYFGALEIDPVTHQVIAMSRQPLVFASEEDDTIICPRDAKYNPSVVFPVGLVWDGDRWLVSGGVHDSRDAWWSFADADLMLVPRAEALKNRNLISNPDATAAPGWKRVMCLHHALFEGGMHYSKGDVFLTTDARVAALGALVTPTDS